MSATCFPIRIITLFPDMFPGPLGESIHGRALRDGVWSLEVEGLRPHGVGKHLNVDDTPCGGGPGMVLRADVVDSALHALAERAGGRDKLGRLVYLSPRGRPLQQELVHDLGAEPDGLTLLCGRFEGVDQRVLDAWGIEEISIGDYVLSGGEVAAMVLAEAVVRLIPGVMGNADTAPSESFETGLLEHPHYTRPIQWTDAEGTLHTVPDILLSGHHGRIADWREAQSRALTRERRPDLLDD
ncbi:MAG: tRNA (guanosine(37)-N1)-methyltransferase TrmD [Alphaproteobacteria bacterium]